MRRKRCSRANTSTRTITTRTGAGPARASQPPATSTATGSTTCSWGRRATPSSASPTAQPTWCAGPSSARSSWPTPTPGSWATRTTSLGCAVHPAGDTDGDGLADFLVKTGTDDGTLLLFEGPSGGELVPADADATFAGEGDGGAAAPAGDVDGDGLPDLWIGLGGLDDGRVGDVGGAILVLGPFNGPFDRSAATATLLGTTEDEVAGGTIASVGDVDGDGRGDLLLGTPDYQGPGGAYLALSPFAGSASLADAHVKFLGEGVDEVGLAVAGPGDVDGDGLADLLLYGPGDATVAEYSGAVWLVYGASLP